MKSRQPKRLVWLRLAALALSHYSRGYGLFVAAMHVLGSLQLQPCAPLSVSAPERRLMQNGFHRCRSQHISSLSPSSTTLFNAQLEDGEPVVSIQNHHPSQPRPDVQRSRKPPLFPGSKPIDTSVDIATCINQTGQSSPTNALLGKPSRCQCRHGYTQAFSLDPMPPTQKINRSKLDRLNSGLMKLTCPLLVSSIDLLEDDGFMKVINSKFLLLEEKKKEAEVEKNEWLTCMDDAHKIHAETRNELISRFGATDRMDAGYGSIEIIESKLGEIGAKSFMDAGVAGASPIASTADVNVFMHGLQVSGTYDIK